jgi:hypothetical protein
MYHAFSYFVSKTVVGFTLLAMLVCVGTYHLNLSLALALSLPSAALHAPVCTHTEVNAECSIIYWMVGLRDDQFYYFLFFVFIVLLTSWAGEVLPPPPPLSCPFSIL